MPTTSAVTRLTLLPSAPSRSGRSEPTVRRYRVARLQLVDDNVARSARFEHLKRSHD